MPPIPLNPSSLDRVLLAARLMKIFTAQKLFSPDRTLCIERIYAGEMPFGPPYFRLRINGQDIPNFIVGHPLVWSDNSAVFATQEWLTTDQKKAPATRVALIDAIN